ncbi:HTH domain protein [Natrialba magadii ATCC 43099]|uniref:HTH domain protein n=1 Tax=Natrialba magadii (strain ATCC 43099 / DSM 3394 / CCM 3739 / CIP 104546 / IAM 13178 / JCM 8861 / NBRC 102185 / NCIMB 2190 / MS3) TaxID=547559 RepID=D3SSY8_NATMM|nr:hypothetical protein [Natrialba magadii]ADD04934.1 HTH domain protein [Natrialba magadii ATCC 43099]ELY23982.1 hypothetical protein C500_19300 [Natrialba magadii ATCC 43099]
MTVVRFDNGKRVVKRWDQVFTAVAAEPRRQVIIALLDQGPDQSVALPAAAINPNVPVDPTTLRQQLVHKHLPLLADLGFVEWESDPLRAVRGDRFDEVAVVFTTLHEAASDVPDSLVVGCQRLEYERQHPESGSE